MKLNNPHKYIGGDAYNYQIEASLLAGDIAAAKITKSLFLISGIMTFIGSLIAIGLSGEINNLTKISRTNSSQGSSINPENKGNRPKFDTGG